jgi:hypothetical protein
VERQGANAPPTQFFFYLRIIFVEGSSVSLRGVNKKIGVIVWGERFTYIKEWSKAVILTQLLCKLMFQLLRVDFPNPLCY